MVTIRAAASEDYERIASRVGGTVTHAREIAEAISQGQCFVAESPEGVVGFVVFNYRFYGNGFIELLMVATTFRRQSVGSALVSHVESLCTTPKLFTSTGESNGPMQRLCEKLGFVRSGLIENLDEDDREVVYLKRLPDRAG